MTEYAKPIKGRETPWGRAQRVEEFAPGIVWCSTASHGGFWLSDERCEKMPEPYRSAERWAGRNWFEEDCDWCLVYLAFPEVCQKIDERFAENIEAAKRTFDHYIKPKLPETPEKSKADAPAAGATARTSSQKEEPCAQPGEKVKGAGRSTSNIMSR